MKKTHGTIKMIAEITIISALAYALDLVQGFICQSFFVNGGSIGIAMLPILFISYRRGFLAGLISGLMLSVLQMIASGGLYVISGAWYLIGLQVMLDYIIAYPLVAFAGLFYKSFQNSKNFKQKNTFLIIGSVTGGLLKLLCHFLAGVIFWSSSCPEGFPGGPYVFSFVYNGGYMIPNIIINTLLLSILAYKMPKLFKSDEF